MFTDYTGRFAPPCAKINIAVGILILVNVGGANTRAAATQSRSRARDCARVGGRTALQLGVMSSGVCCPPLLSSRTPAAERPRTRNDLF